MRMTFSVHGDFKAILASLLRPVENGHLCFGWSATSLAPASPQDFIAAPVLFRDYIMEGFVEYSVMAADSLPGCLLAVEGYGSNRDQYIVFQVRHYIEAAGFAISKVDTV
jgi:hypothetical protein